MSLFLYELATSRSVDRSADSASVTRKWIANGSADENAVAAALLIVAPVRWDSLPRTRYTIEPIGGAVWMCTVVYSLSANTQTDDPEEEKDPNDDTDLGSESSFDLTAGTAHITQGLGTSLRWLPGKTTDTPAGDAIAFGVNATLTEFLYAPASTKLTLDGYTFAGGHVGAKLCLNGPGFTTGAYPIVAGAGATVTVNGRIGTRIGISGASWVIDNGNLGTAEDVKSAIGVTLDSVDGTEIVVPKFEFSWSRQVFPVNLPYLRRLRSVVGKTNNAIWRGFAKGEVLYLGATGTPAPGGVWKVAHKFAVGENLYGVRVSDKLVLPLKNAWDYLWCSYGYTADNVSRFQKATAAYVEKVYRDADFSLLGLGK